VGELTMLKLPRDEFVTIELVHAATHSASGAASGLSHLVIQVEAMHATLDALGARGITAEGPSSPNGTVDFWTAWIVDPDGNRIELVQWPAGHPDGMTAADWPD
jgi:lactoylglutathione lyase